jgi:hypothetical protein
LQDLLQAIGPPPLLDPFFELGPGESSHTYMKNSATNSFWPHISALSFTHFVVDELLVLSPLECMCHFFCVILSSLIARICCTYCVAYVVSSIAGTSPSRYYCYFFFALLFSYHQHRDSSLLEFFCVCTRCRLRCCTGSGQHPCAHGRSRSSFAPFSRACSSMYSAESELSQTAASDAATAASDAATAASAAQAASPTLALSLLNLASCPDLDLGLILPGYHLFTLVISFELLSSLPLGSLWFSRSVLPRSLLHLNLSGVKLEKASLGKLKQLVCRGYHRAGYIFEAFVMRTVIFFNKYVF